MSPKSPRKRALCEELNQKGSLLPVKASDKFQRKQKGQQLYEVMLNQVFLGNPGTGKTTETIVC
jgi:hypothetical protein